MTGGDWLLALLWLAGILMLVAILLLAVALADPARRGHPGEGAPGPAAVDPPRPRTCGPGNS